MRRLSPERPIARRVALAVLAASCAITAVSGPANSASADSPTLNVDTNSTVQSNFLGVNAVYHGFSYMPEDTDAGMNDGLRSIDFDRIQQVNLHLARTWYGSDWAQPTIGGPYNWDSPKMTAFYRWLQAMKDRNVTVALNLGWWFSESLCSNNTRPATCTPTDANVASYADWVSQSMKQLIQVRGFTNIKYGMLFTEALEYPAGNIPSGYTAESYYNYVGNTLVNKLSADGVRNLIQIVGPDSGNLQQNSEPLTYAAQNMNNVFDVYSSHDYSLDYPGYYNEVTAARQTIAATGKQFWMDEFGNADTSFRDTPNYGTYLGFANAGALNAGAQTTLNWLYEDQKYVAPLNNETNSDAFQNGIHKWGVQKWLPDDLNVRPAWYAFSLMSRFLGGAGTKVYKVSAPSNGFTLTATRSPAGAWTFMVTNVNSATASVNLHFSSAIGQTLYAHIYDPAHVPSDNQVIPTSAVFPNVGTDLSISLPSNGVGIFTAVDDGSAPANASSVNTALNKPVAATSTVTFTNNYGASNLTDGSLDDFWTSTQSDSSSVNESATVDFGATKALQRVVLFPRKLNGNSFDFPSDFAIQSSSNGSDWTTLHSETGFAEPSNGLGVSFPVGHQVARYIRVAVTKARADEGAGRYYAQLAEIEAYNTNVSSGAPVAVSSNVSFTSSYGAANLTDGSFTNFWTSQQSASAPCNETASLDLGTAQSVKRVTLYPRLNGGQTAAFPATFTIETSLDGASWTTASTQATVTDSAANAGLVIPVSVASARYVRVHATQASSDGANYYVQLAEVDVY